MRRALSGGGGFSSACQVSGPGTPGGNAVHRSLRRLEGLNLVTHTKHAAPGTGVKRKVYELTRSGKRVLAAYLETTLSYLHDPEFLAAVHAGRSPDC
ncbi:helix-turn-helix transcriptional regulator [Actinopolyspora mortivallis]|uniref:Transcription regulator PadR N-terminal domain-containing protein n=1 Tax=Actinopolyspora mortivallis TaxID=33906 RepID=A0A2T0H061_ACTMO|nr:helix-turn-helix transcriptional regulator [Actinopolyspora mortivallis]PRW64758.1 hypothetical protein CEP50_02665 [Actinopolyspora mortivallis]